MAGGGSKYNRVESLGLWKPSTTYHFALCYSDPDLDGGSPDLLNTRRAFS